MVRKGRKSESIKAGCLLLTLALLVGCERNHSPVINGITCEPPEGGAGTRFTLEVSASDEDGDPLTYRWEANGGEFRDSTNQKVTSWKSPGTGAGQTYTLTVEVSDGKTSSMGDMRITLGEPEFGTLSGQVRFTNYNLPVPDATITVEERSVTTDEQGRFQIPEIPVGTYTLTVSRPDFTNYSSDVTIGANQTIIINPEITSVLHTTKLTGNVTDQDGEAIAGALVVVLNPDGSESKLNSLSNATGFYRIWYIPQGQRSVKISRASTDDNDYTTTIQEVACNGLEIQVLLKMQRIPRRGRFTDPRDGHTYGFNKISKYVWMTENLAYLPEVMPPSQVSENERRYFVYGYDGTDTATAAGLSNYKNYGVLYNYTAAKTACPPGWRLPDSNRAWPDLIVSVGMPAGTKLKSTGGWEDHGNGTN
ncbi:MAG: carboxypeptidase regulatory-like domain-containing protein, partial [Bacteroidales bacterium]